MKGLTGDGRCLKCLKGSGDDWSQCRGTCPVPCSPHYVGYDPFEFHAWPPDKVGGQHLNRSGCGVLIVYKPFGIGAMSMDERSQLQNRENAMVMLRSLIQFEESARFAVELAKLDKPGDIPF